MTKKDAFVPYLDPPQTFYHSLKKWKVSSKTRKRDIWLKRNISAYYAQIEIKRALLFPKELLLSRKALDTILSARTRHEDFAAYHTHFNNAEVRLAY